MRFGLHSTLKQILDSEKARAVLLKHSPGADQHPDLAQALYMTIAEIATYPQAELSPSQLEALVNELQAIEE